MNDVGRPSALITVGIIALVAFLIVAAVLVGSLLWELGRVLV